MVQYNHLETKKVPSERPKTANSGLLYGEISPFERNKHEILYNLINSLLAGLLVGVGSFVEGGFSVASVCTAILTTFAVFIYRLKKYWETQESEYCGLFCFI